MSRQGRLTTEEIDEIAVAEADDETDWEAPVHVKRSDSNANDSNEAGIPDTDSIEELARFWDTHDATDFEGNFEEVIEPLFEPKGN